MAVAAAGRDHVWIGDGDVLQVVADDGVRSAIELTTERGQLDLALAQGAVGEQELGALGHGD